jgi:hypothetical protein
MSGFTSDWLALREPADHRARAPGLAARVGAAFGEHEEIAVIDLGAGTGANLRYLAPRLGRRQHWTLVDDTPALLAAVGAASHDWARALSLTIPSRSAALHWQGDGLDCDAVVCRHDLTELDTLDLPEGALVTASALLDLVSAPWLQRLAARAAGAHATCLFALSYDGRIALTPADPLDAEIASLVNRHQTGDKGFGPALGPSAIDTACDAFARQGFSLERATSDWRLDSGDRALAAELLRGWAEAASDTAPERAAEIARWLKLRLEANARGRLGVLVGHEDLLALPARRPPA